MIYNRIYTGYDPTPITVIGCMIHKWLEREGVGAPSYHWQPRLSQDPTERAGVIACHLFSYEYKLIYKVSR
jgi:hypothetical protein